MPFNKEVLLRAKATMLEEPNRIRMSSWGIRFTPEEIQDGEGTRTDLSTYYGDLLPAKMPSCNTVGCAAFWICANEMGMDRAIQLSGHNLSWEAMELVGIISVRDLFYPSRWYHFSPGDKDYAVLYKAAETQEGKAKVIGQVIDTFISHHEHAMDTLAKS